MSDAMKAVMRAAREEREDWRQRAEAAEARVAALSEPIAVIRRIGGDVDDVAISGDTFRMEQMAADDWWVCIYRGDKRTMFSLYWDRKAKCLRAIVTEDSIGCHDDTQEARDATR